MASSKSLSTSTLSLRFMQNAHHAKELKEVELDRAEVKDDEKWEVSQAVRESWGLNAEVQSGSSEVHETSYIPFLFSETESVRNESTNDDAPIKKTTGRRVFNKKGEMIPAGSSTENTRSVAVSTESSAPQSSSGRQIHPRPVTISATGTSGHLRGFDQLKKPKDAKISKSAREAIFESGGVGTDLRSESRKDPPPSASTTFMKPAGVDDPKNIQTASNVGVIPNSEDVIDGARQKKKIKREREAAADETNEGSKRSKKNTKNPE